MNATNEIDTRRFADAMQTAWNDFCDDTGCYPDCFERRGRKLYADFSRGNFSLMVASAFRNQSPRVSEPTEGENQ